MLCVICKNWGHLKCSNESELFFRSNGDWTCDKCVWKSLPFADLSCSSSNIDLRAKSNVENNESCNTDDDRTNDGEIEKELTRLKYIKGLKVAHLNCVSLIKHFDEIRSLITESGSDIMTLSETHLCSNIEDNEISIPGYTLLRRDRNRSGGGVAMYIKNDLIFVRKNELCNDSDLELLVIEIKQDKQKPFLVICWYRPPNSKVDVLNSFDNFMQKIDDLKVSYYILGDMNCDVKCKSWSWHTRKFLDIMESYDCSQLIDRYTRITKNSSTAVDLIFSNCKTKVSESGVVEVSVSDHYMIYCIIGKSKSDNIDNHKYKTGRSMKNFDQDSFKKDMVDINFDPLYKIKDPEAACSAFLSLITPIIDKHAPLKRTRIKQKDSPWMTANIIKLMRKRDRLKQKAKNSKKDADWNKYKKARNNVTTLIRQTKRDFISAHIESSVHDVKKVWKTLRYLAPERKSDTEATSIKVDGNYIHCQEMSNAFNEYFSTVGETLHKTFSSTKKRMKRKRSKKLPNQSLFVFTDTVPNDVEKVIKNLPINKATGPDNLPTKLLKPVASTIAPAITHILNQSFRTGSIPSGWKCARVTPIFKGGDKTCLENYRPISVIPILAKIMEKIAYDQTIKYLTENKVLTNCQSGFRSMHSTETALINVTEKWLKEIDNGNIVGIVMIDLKKAFDTIDHSILLEKLEMHGFDHSTLKWFKNYFEDRRQFTSVNGYISDERTLTCGVPQGSLLGPLLFTLFVNDMPNYVKSCEVSLYADDTCLFTSSNDPRQVEKKLNEDISNLSLWLKQNKLLVNPKKCEAMFIGTRQRLKNKNDAIKHCHISIEGNEIQKVDSCKYLGVIIDKNLSWNDHIERVRKKVIKSIYLLKRLRSFINERTALLFYRSIIQCNLDYCSSVWSNGSKSQLDKLQFLQNRALRIVMNVEYLFPTSTLYETLKLDRLQVRWSKLVARTMYRAVNKLCPSYLSDIFSFRETPYCIRSNQCKLRLIQPKTNYGKRSLAYRGAKLWNDLDYLVSTPISIETFKRYLNRNPALFLNRTTNV